MISAILLSGGVGARMGASTPKQYLPLAGKPVVLHSFEKLSQCDLLSEIIVVCDSSYEYLFAGVRFAKPGKRRQDSLLNALGHLHPLCEYVLVHDAARPFLNESDLQKVIQTAKKYGASALATPTKSTIKQADKNLFVTQTLSRVNLYETQTPQVLKKSLVFEGFQKVFEDSLTITDDILLAEILQKPTKLVLGSYENIKITTPEDLCIAENILRERSLSF